METNQKEKDEIEIDIRELFFILLDKIWIIIAVGLVFCLATGIYSKVLIKPLYTSTTKLYVLSRQSTTTTLSDLQTGTQLTKDYVVVVKSRPVVEEVINTLGLNLTYEELVDSISVNTPSETRIIEIVIENTDPYVAKQIADEMAEISVDRMMDVMDMDTASIIEPGNLPTAPSSPNVKKNAVIGGVLGVFLSIFGVLLVYILNDSIKSADDVERYLSLNTLGTIPLEEGTVNNNKKKKKRKSNHK